MKTYHFYIASQNLTMTVPATNKQDAIKIVVHQCNIKTSQASKAIICLGINLNQGLQS